MDENDEYSNASIERRKKNELRIDSKERLKPVRDLCCIYRVPVDLRKINQKAYTPQFISIGPFHYRKKKLINMEKQKVRYKEDFGRRIEAGKWENLITFIRSSEQDIRNSYAETFKLRSLEFVTMILYDAIFIIEFLLKNNEDRLLKNNEDRTDDPLIFNPRLRSGILLDLQLLENQLPYFVLEQLFILSEWHDKGYPNFLSLSCKFFSDPMCYRGPERRQFKHFLDLRRCSLVKTFPQAQSKGILLNLPCAVKLHEAGVKFMPRNGNSLLDVHFKQRRLMKVTSFLNVSELQIPRLVIDDSMESLFRNLMALEQCHYAHETHVCNYIILIDYLINTEHDVELLVGKGIITNCLGDEATVAKMINRLCCQINLSYSGYVDIAEKLKAHHDNWWNHAKSTLKSVYFSNPWRGTATIAAVILLLLTFIQTVCSILQVV